MQNIKTIDADKFRGCTHFTLTPHSSGNRIKIQDPEAHRLYLEQLAREIAEAKARKEGKGAVSLAEVAADGKPNGSGKGADLSKVGTTGNKRPLVSPAREKLCSFLTETKTNICGPSPAAIAQPSYILPGLYVVADALVQNIDDRITEAGQRLNESWLDDKGQTQPGYIAAFVEDIPAAIERARTLPLLEGGLGPLWSAADYMDAARGPQDTDEARRQRWIAAQAAQFSLELNWLSFRVPENLPEALKAKALDAFNTKVSDAADKCVDALRCSLGGFVDNLVEKLAPTPDGKPRVFRDTLVENIRQFCASFNAKNLFGDADLEALVAKAQAILSDPKITPDNLRKYSDVRQNTLNRFAEIQSTLSGMIETKKGRAFDFGADEAA